LKLTKASQKPRRQKLQLLQLPGARATPPASSACPRKRIQTIRKDFPVGQNEIQIPRKVTQTLFLCELNPFEGLRRIRAKLRKLRFSVPAPRPCGEGGHQTRARADGRRRHPADPLADGGPRPPLLGKDAHVQSHASLSIARGVAGEEENIKRDVRHHELCGERRHDGVVRDSTHWVMGERQAETTAMSSRSLTRRRASAWRAASR
jgi:hypothetical protein